MLISTAKRQSTIDQYLPSQRLEASKSQEPTTVFTPWQQETHHQYASSQFRNFLDSKLKHPDFANRDWAIQGSCSSIPDIESYTQNLMSPLEQKMDSGRIQGSSVRRHTAEKLRSKNRNSFRSPKKQTSTLETYSNELSSMPNTPQSKRSNSKTPAILVNSKNNEFWSRYNKKLDSKFATLAIKQKTEMDLVPRKNSINKDKTLAKFLKKRISTEVVQRSDTQIGKPKNSTNLQYRNSLPESQVKGTTENRVLRNQTLQNDLLDDSSESSDELSSSSRVSDYEEIEGSKLQEDYKQKNSRTSTQVEPSKNSQGLQRKSEQAMTVGKAFLSDQKRTWSRVATSPDHLNDTAQRLTSIERLKSLASEGNSFLAVRGTTPVNFNSHLVRASAPNVLRPSTRYLSSEGEGKNEEVILNSISMTNKIWSQHINQYEVAQIPLLQNLKPSFQGFKKKTESLEKPKRQGLQLTLSSKTSKMRPHLSRKSQIMSLQNSGASSPKEAQQNIKISSFAHVSQFFHLNKDFRTVSISKSTVKDEFNHFIAHTEEEPQGQKIYKIPSKPRTQATLESFRASSQRKITTKDLNPSPKTLGIEKGRFIKRK